MKKNHIPFNIDAGEGIGNESLVFPYVDWCNISCGAHAGSTRETESTILLAEKYKLKIGAHPSYPDRENFGRVAQDISKEKVKSSLIYQLTTFKEICKKAKIDIYHIKPHGALYHQIAENESVAKIFFDILKELKLEVGIIGSPDSLFEVYCQKFNLPFYPEVFADRRYAKNGKLIKRSENGAILSNQQEINHQVLSLLKENLVETENGTRIFLDSKTICFHGDHKGCELILKNVHNFLASELYR